ncbi:hypothetical protein SAMD00023353_3500900 [Rosellinia necatrix]|uniref:Uncharacterized protein n=1 Tax=Rosellinia necatrix TaxID=77044 RepID=A0A1S8A984_ROSNE|nr:hypothetical protein SAMD00023353_3500900 [Rosellinia necatrix]
MTVSKTEMAKVTKGAERSPRRPRCKRSGGYGGIVVGDVGDVGDVQVSLSENLGGLDAGGGRIGDPDGGCGDPGIGHLEGGRIG